MRKILTCIVCVIGLLLIAFLFLKTREYQKVYVKQLSSKEHPFRLLYSLCLYLLLETKLYNVLERKKEEQELLKQLHIGEDACEVQLLYWCKKLSVLITVFVGSILLILALEFGGSGAKSLLNKGYLERADVGQGNRQIVISVDIEGKDAEEVQVEVPEQTYTDKELQKKMEEAKKYVTKNYLGNNKNEQEICSSLYLMNQIANSSISVTWTSWNDRVIGEDGSLHNGLLQKTELCELTATLMYGDRAEELNFSVMVNPADDLTQEEWRDVLNTTIEEVVQNNLSHKKIELPQAINGKMVTYAEAKKKSQSGILFLFTIGIAVLLWISFSQELKRSIEKREQQMLVDYPELINKFTLLLSAGMTVNMAWGKIATEYRKKVEEGRKKKRFAYEEWELTWIEMSNGVSELAALEHFGQRTKLMPYLKFSTLLAQNLRKGSKGLLALLEYEAMDAFENRKQMTKRLAEEAGTKLLAPMMIMLILVMVIIMTPAFQSL